MNLNNHPVIKFAPTGADQAIYVVNCFLRSSWSERIYSQYPTLRRRLHGVRSERKRNIIVYSFLREEEDRIDLAARAGAFQRCWDREGAILLKRLAEIAEMPWSANLRNFTANVSLCPICPRYLNTNSFDIFSGFTTRKMRIAVLHEMLHFIYFAKWQKLYPRTKPEHREYPHLVWRLSEIVPRAMLSDSKVQKIFRHKPPVYQVFEEMKLESRPLLSIIQEFYDQRKDAEDFLRKSFAFMQRNQREFEFVI